MAEYIKREVATDAVTEVYYNTPNVNLSGAKFAAAINAIPAADVAPVVHGRWEYTPQTFNTLGQIRCPFCAWWSLDQSIDGIYKYCPNCGGKMDGGIVDG
jgi:hypothetical protein